MAILKHVAGKSADYGAALDYLKYEHDEVLKKPLLDANGKANDKFWTWTYIRRSHPRTAIGYFEPGHYCLLLVDGRQQNSRGMFLDEMAKVFEDLGCKVAYNLDGGHCSFMEMNGKVVNDPYKPEHEIEDGIFITEGSL